MTDRCPDSFRNEFNSERLYPFRNEFSSERFYSFWNESGWPGGWP